MTKQKKDKIQSDAETLALEVDAVMQEAVEELGPLHDADHDAEELEELAELEEAEQAEAASTPPLLGAGTDCPVCGTADALTVELRQSHRYERCEECAGLGMVLTGSLVAEAAALPCENCQGRGYAMKPSASSTYVPELPAPPSETRPIALPGQVWDEGLKMFVWPTIAQPV